MKRSLIIPIFVLLTLLFLVYAFIQKGFADEAKMEANRQQKIALQQKVIADSLLMELNRLKLRCK